MNDFIVVTGSNQGCDDDWCLSQEHASDSVTNLPVNRHVYQQVRLVKATDILDLPFHKQKTDRNPGSNTKKYPSYEITVFLCLLSSCKFFS